MKNNIAKNVLPNILSNLFEMKKKNQIIATDSAIRKYAKKQANYYGRKAENHILNKVIRSSQDTVLYAMDGIFDFINKIKDFRQEQIKEGIRQKVSNHYSQLKSNEILMKVTPKGYKQGELEKENEEHKKWIKHYTKDLSPKEKQNLYKYAQEVFNGYDKPGLVSELRRDSKNILGLRRMGLLKK